MKGWIGQLETVIKEFKYYCISLCKQKDNMNERIHCLEGLVSQTAFQREAMTTNHRVASSRVEVLRESNLTVKKQLGSMIDMRDQAYTELEKQYFKLRKEFEELGGKFLEKEMALAREENMRALK